MAGPPLTPANKNNNAVLAKIYYPNPTNYRQHGQPGTHRKNNEVEQGSRQRQPQPELQQQQQSESGQPKKKGFNSGNILQYYYNNINNNDFTATNVNANVTNNAEYLAKQSNININNIFAVADGQEKTTPEKNPFSSNVRPLSMKIATPRPVSNFFTKTFRSDSQKRPLLLNYTNGNDGGGGEVCGPNFKIIPDKTGLKISPIYSISENLERYTSRKLKQQSSYFPKGSHAAAAAAAAASSSRPLFVKK